MNAGSSLTFDGEGAFNVTATGGTSTMNMTFDPCTAGTITMPNIDPNATPLATDRLLILNATNTVLTRTLTSLVDANNGLIIDANGAVPVVQLGDTITGTAHQLTRSRFVNLGTQNLNFEGAGNFVVGDGTGSSLGITFDQGTANTSFIRMLNVPANTPPLATDKFVYLDAATNHVNTRLLSSLVAANNGLIVDNTSNPGQSIVQLGDSLSAAVGSQLSRDRWIGMNGKNLTFEGSGAISLGALAATAGGSVAGNVNVNVNTGTSNMTITGANLDQSGASAGASFNNMAWIDSTTNVVHRTTTAALARDNAAIDFIAIDHTSGAIVRAVSPTAGIYRGHVSWTNWQQTITLGAGQTIQAGASITVSIENHATAGTVAIQVTNVTTNGNTFDIETADVPTTGSFINYVVMNP